MTTALQDVMKLARNVIMAAEISTYDPYGRYFSNTHIVALAQALLSVTRERDEAVAEAATNLAAAKAAGVELLYCSQQLAAKGSKGHPGDSVSRALEMTAAVQKSPSRGSALLSKIATLRANQRTKGTEERCIECDCIIENGNVADDDSCTRADCPIHTQTEAGNR